jgi:hypothetical protein
MDPPSLITIEAGELRGLDFRYHYCLPAADHDVARSAILTFVTIWRMEPLGSIAVIGHDAPQLGLLPLTDALAECGFLRCSGALRYPGFIHMSWHAN